MVRENQRLAAQYEKESLDAIDTLGFAEGDYTDTKPDIQETLEEDAADDTDPDQ